MSGAPLMAPVAHLAAMAPYALAELRGEGARPVSLAQNESLRGPSPAALDAAAAALAGAALYPDPDWHDLRAAIAAGTGAAAETILCGAGSMELIAALARAWLGPGRRAVTTAHAYAYFATATALAGAALAVAPETGRRVDVAALFAAARPGTALVFVANPGNPTGTCLAPAEIARLRDGLPPETLLVVDEAYGEFAPEGTTALPLVARGDTVVLRTFSKAYGLAGLRVGWGAFPPAVAAELRKTLVPNNLSAPAQAAAAAAMRDPAYMRETVRLTALRRVRFAQAVRAAGIATDDSHANFVLLRFAGPEAAAAADAALRAGGILLRGMAGYGLPHALRATVGGEADMARAAEILAARGPGGSR